MPVRTKATPGDGQDPGGCSTATNHVPPAPPSAAVALSPRPASGSAIRVRHRFLKMEARRLTSSPQVEPTVFKFQVQWIVDRSYRRWFIHGELVRLASSS